MNALSLRSPLLLALLATICLVLIGATVTIVPETREAVIVRGAEVIDVYNGYRPGEYFGRTGAGLKLRVPVLDRVVWIDKRIQSLALADQPVLSADQQPLQVDAVARYRVVDPRLFYVKAASLDGLSAALRPAFDNALRTELGKRPFESLTGPEQGSATAELRSDLDRVARRYGANVIDVRITRTSLPAGAPLQGALERMSAARTADAEAIRAEGTKEALAITAQANADAARVYQSSFGRDPQFYDFYRAMQSYRAVFDPATGKETNMVLSPDSDYLRQFRGH